MHSSTVLLFPSPINWHLHRCTAFCISPHWHFCSCNLPITHSHLFMGPLSVTMHVRAFTCFCNNNKCFGFLWIGKSYLMCAGVILCSICIICPPYALSFALLSASPFLRISVCPFIHINVQPVRHVICSSSSIHDLIGCVNSYSILLIASWLSSAILE